MICQVEDYQNILKLNHIIFWKTVIRTSNFIYVNYFNWLSFLAVVSPKLQKMTPSTFSAQTVAFIFIFENSQNSFTCGSPSYGLLWSVKYLNFGEKLSIRTVHHAFLESRHPKVTKNPYYVSSPKGEPEKGISHGLIPLCRGLFIYYFKISPPIYAVLSFLKIVSTLKDTPFHISMES